jgi:hypothetical protein
MWIAEAYYPDIRNHDYHGVSAFTTAVYPFDSLENIIFIEF